MFLRSPQLVGVLALQLFICTQAHFVLQVPTSLGFDDDAEGTAPCGGFDATSRLNVTSWPVSGGNIGLLTVHPNVTWEFNAALSTNLTIWTSLTPVLNQTGVGQFCEPQIPTDKKWVGQDGVLQVIQHGPDGALYQCAAVKFVSGPHSALSPNCTNSTGTAAHWLV